MLHVHSWKNINSFQLFERMKPKMPVIECTGRLKLPDFLQSSPFSVLLIIWMFTTTKVEYKCKIFLYLLQLRY